MLIKKIVPIIISLVIIGLLYSKVEFEALLFSLDNIDYVFLFISLSLMFPIVLVSSWRFKIIASKFTNVTYMYSLAYLLSSHTLNFIVPSKMGSISKVYFLQRINHLSWKRSISVNIYERLTDLCSISIIYLTFTYISFEGKGLVFIVSLICILYLLGFIIIHYLKLPYLSSSSSWARIVNKVINIYNLFTDYIHAVNDTMFLLRINLISLVLWIMHTFQLVLFVNAIHVSMPFALKVSYMLCSIIVGLVPLTLSGLGVRDWAIIQLTEGLIDYNRAVLLGMLTLLRNLIPCLIGLPFFYYITHNIMNRKGAEHEKVIS